MIGLDYLAAGYFHLAAADLRCKSGSTPAISVTASDTSVRYDHSRTQAQLDNFQHDTVSPYDKSVQTHVGGLMAGEVTISQNIRIMQETWAQINTGCLYVSAIKVEIKIKPTIYIASDYPKGGCMYRAIMEHEKKHIAVDQRIVAKYKPLITDAVYGAVRELGISHGPMPMGSMVGEQERLQTYVQDKVRAFTGKMSEERRREQQKVDTLAEYQRVQGQCRGKG